MPSTPVSDNSFTTAFNGTSLTLLMVLNHICLYHDEFNTFFRISALGNG